MGLRPGTPPGGRGAPTRAARAGYGGRMMAASYAIAGVLLFGATVLAAGILAALLLLVKAMDKGPGDL